LISTFTFFGNPLNRHPFPVPGKYTGKVFTLTNTSFTWANSGHNHIKIKIVVFHLPWLKIHFNPASCKTACRFLALPWLVISHGYFKWLLYWPVAGLMATCPGDE
jgi:hypothetical protein